MKYLLSLFAALILNALANLLMKIGMKSIQSTGGIFKDGVVSAATTVLSTPSLLIGLTCFALNAAFYMYALQSPTLKISLAYPIMVGGSFALIAVIARFHPDLAERLNRQQWLGVALVLAGIVLIAARAGATSPGQSG